MEKRMKRTPEMVKACALGVCVVLAACLGACTKSPAPTSSDPGAPASSTDERASSEAKRPASTSASQAGRAPEPAMVAIREARFSAPGRVVAVGDLHGDLAATREVLQLAGAIDEHDRWLGGELTLVQTGDQLDRGDDERAILDLLLELQKGARAAGGAVIVLNGNHETMNAMGDFRYVTPGARGDFASADDRELPRSIAERLPPDLRDRAAALLPGGRYARLLAERPIVAVVDDTVFAHGGVHLEHVKYGIDRLNRETAEWLTGGGPAPEFVLSEHGPLWSRSYSEPVPSPRACEELGQVLQAVGAKRMVVGHTVQQQGITSACDGRVWRIDVGMSSYYGGDRVMALQIDGAEVRVLQRPKRAVLAPAAE